MPDLNPFAPTRGQARHGSALLALLLVVALLSGIGLSIGVLVGVAL